MLVPESWATDGLLDHVDEGPDDITGHVKVKRRKQTRDLRKEGDKRK